MNNDQPNEENFSVSGEEVKNYFFNLLRQFLDLEEGVDKWGTIQTIKSKQAMSGANAWMLMCSILITSIGLNLNSQAVIIGAMLISPLMSPILGIGLGVAINDKDALYHALLHFGTAIFIALLFSTLYFWLIPLNEFTEQIAARTEPTFLDILIGVFGGIAGIVSYARKDISTTIPGVAIATALMPPLCVTGYGIANGNWEVISKSFYLFFLNSFFVAMATYVVLRYLKFPYKEYASQKERRKNKHRVGVFAILIIVPSFFIFVNVYKEYKQNQKIKEFITNCIGEDEIFLDNYTLKEQSDGTSTLYLKVYGETINESRVPFFNSTLDSMGLSNVKIEIIPTSEIPLQKVRQLETDLNEVGLKLNSQIKQLKDDRDALQRLIENLNNSSEFNLNDSMAFSRAVQDIRIFMPDIDDLGLAYVQYSGESMDYNRMPTALVKAQSVGKDDADKLSRYLKQRFNLDTINILFVN